MDRTTALVRSSASIPSRLLVAVDQYSLPGVARILLRTVTRRTAESFTSALRTRLVGARGLEVGGPTPHLFGRRGLLPIYPLVERVDNVNFVAGATSWEHVVEGDTFAFDHNKPAGTQYVGEATALPMLADASVDFVLSSHTIEHTADPLRAVREWRRVLRPGGTLVLVAPDPTRTFDRRRPVTSFAHLLDDERRGTPESDLSHMDEVVACHDVRLDGSAPRDPQEFRARCLRNAETRNLHHHVFDLPLLAQLVEHAGFRLLDSERLLPVHLVTVAEARA